MNKNLKKQVAAWKKLKEKGLNPDVARGGKWYFSDASEKIVCYLKAKDSEVINCHGMENELSGYDK